MPRILLKHESPKLLQNKYLTESKEFVRLLDQSRRIFLLSHLHTDSDDFGASLGLWHTLRALGYKAQVVVKGQLPAFLVFLQGSEAVVQDLPGDMDSEDLIVISGCSEIGRTGFEQLATGSVRIVNIDHHPDNIFYGGANIVDPQASSVAEIVYWIFLNLKWPISYKAAECLLLGIMGDTGNFRFSNTCSRALLAVSGLVALGGRPLKIINQLALARTREIKNTWVHSLSAAGIHPLFECVSAAILGNNWSSGNFDGIVDYLNRAAGAKFTLLARQDGNVVKGSLRSTPFQATDVGRLARAFGGGGHKYAAGFSLPGTLRHLPNGGWEVLDKSNLKSK